MAKLFEDKFKLLIVLGAFLLVLLRFWNLGYSEYIPDEISALTYLRKNNQFYSAENLINRRKGPVSFVIAYIPFFITNDIFNEGVQRIPFALANIIALYFFGKFVFNLTKNRYIAYIAAFLLGVNGFIVAFGRIVQYQSLNLLFSSISLFFYSNLLKGQKLYKNSLLGTFFFCLSFLSHWDAVFILPVVYYFFSKSYNVKILVVNGLFAGLLLFPFMSPYILNYLGNLSRQSYFNSRVSIGGISLGKKINDYTFRTKLYNPFVLTPLVLLFSLFSLRELKRSFFCWLWLSFMILFFLIFVKRSGTHIYNLFLPLSILASCGVVSLYKSFESRYKKVLLVFIFTALSFLWYQSFLLFVSTKTEYPWSQEKIIGLKTREYTHKNLTNNIIGFPIRRNWLQINDFVNSYGLTYVTNEEKSIASFYMDAQRGESAEYFAIGIKKPLSFVNDYKFPQIKNKETVKNIKLNGRTVARIYLVDNEK